MDNHDLKEKLIVEKEKNTKKIELIKEKQQQKDNWQGACIGITSAIVSILIIINFSTSQDMILDKIASLIFQVGDAVILGTLLYMVERCLLALIYGFDHINERAIKKLNEKNDKISKILANLEKVLINEKNNQTALETQKTKQEEHYNYQNERETTLNIYDDFKIKKLGSIKR